MGATKSRKPTDRRSAAKSAGTGTAKHAIATGSAVIAGKSRPTAFASSA